MFTELARKKAAKYWEKSFEHPFVQSLARGDLAPEIFRYYLLQDRYYLEHFSKLYGYIAKQTIDKEVQAHLQKNAENLKQGELAIREEFFSKLAISEAEILTTPIAPTAYHYVSHMYRQLIEGTPNTAFAGMLPCAWLYQEIGERLITVGSPDPVYQCWIETYAGETAVEGIKKERVLLDRLYEESTEKEQQQMIEAFVISSKLEYAFWGMAMTLEKW
ncbi:thiaminase II [Enterococcus dongliensis]|uniref:Aminopyrimidine aminohydrolase n=1 Tax=Enterococcus dongliensis TaxID=2559925 RepID=A0AAW8TJE1_9ENTE|nr:thiaminase II [Enterococcus dongliensis]MDT2596054.1 thiaminase II [Enterococcus dongliensis]MDT2635294.1 thiaminase II [Enterococcus dongliensis]MDT2636908.1 thiaminase II [Enterococcus dongliensis]MDT2641998.1 thiaminase II [Enterococcus dongliensis]MDT2647278.1 thiaminase II [Enterococcus dongliensis]